MSSIPDEDTLHEVLGNRRELACRGSHRPPCAAATTPADPAPSPARMESGDEGDSEAAGASGRRTRKGRRQRGPLWEEELLAEARPAHRPVLLFPERLGLAPPPFPSRLALPPQ